MIVAFAQIFVKHTDVPYTKRQCISVKFICAPPIGRIMNCFNFFNSMCYFNTFGSYPIAATVSELYFSNFWNLIVVSPFHFLLSNTIQTDFLAKATCCIFVEKVQRSLFIYCCDCLASHSKSICMEGNVNVDSNTDYPWWYVEEHWPL